MMQHNLTNWGTIPDRWGPDSARQSGDVQRLSYIADAADQSVQELADSDQALEAGIVDGVEDAADHPERPVHTHLEYGRPDDLPPRAGSDELEEQEITGTVNSAGNGEVNVEDLTNEDLPDEDLPPEISEQVA